MAIFFGEFETSIDAKHRLAIGSMFRDQIVPAVDGENWILILGPNRRLRLYPDLAYRKLVEKKMQTSALPNRQESTISLWFGLARHLRCDTQGRVVLPEKSMERASIGEKVTLVGINDHLEIWPTETWERHVDEMLSSPSYDESLYDAGDRMLSGDGEAGPSHG